MTINKVTRITGGLSIEQLGRHTFKVTVHDDGWEDQVLTFSGITENRALHNLVEGVYAVRCERAMERDGWQCTEPGCETPRNGLQCHHKVFRSHGRLDTLENLRTLCLNHHEAQHK